MHFLRATAAFTLAAYLTPAAASAFQPQATTQQGQLPVDMAKIREVLRQDPQLRLDTEQIRFFVEIIGRIPTFKEIVGDYNLKVGPVPGAGMTHEEFLQMVTPQDLHSTTGITALETLQVALTSHALISAVKRAYEEWKEARTDRERRAIQQRIERELQELEKLRARKGGGLAALR